MLIDTSSSQNMANRVATIRILQKVRGLTALARCIIVWLLVYGGLQLWLSMRTSPMTDPFTPQLDVPTRLPATLVPRAEHLQYTIAFRNRKGKIRAPLRPMEQISTADLPDLFNDDKATASSAATLTIDIANVLFDETKRIVLDTLRNAGIKVLDARIYDMLPDDKQISALYGSAPVIVGLDRCKAYRSSVKATDRYAGAAGMFNAGTTALSMYLEANIPSHANWTGVEFEHRHEVPWGKHRLLELADKYTIKGADNLSKEHVLPVVIVRHPFFWFQSMCQAPYMAFWKHNNSLHCPNILATLPDMKQYPELQFNEPVPVTLTAQKRTFDSLAHLWEEWYAAYLGTDRPRLIIRQEDLVYRPRQVMQAILDCIGANAYIKGSLVYVVGRSKWTQEHVKHQSSMVSSMIKYSMAANRLANMTLDEIVYAEKVMGEMMDLFQYQRSSDV